MRDRWLLGLLLQNVSAKVTAITVLSPAQSRVDREILYERGLAHISGTRYRPRGASPHGCKDQHSSPLHQAVAPYSISQPSGRSFERQYS